MADEYIRLDTTIMGIDGLINEAPTGSQARALFCAKDMIYDQQRYVSEMKPVKRGKWKYYKNNGIFDTHKCTLCGEKYEIYMDIEPTTIYKYCPNCGAKMIKDGEQNE